MSPEEKRFSAALCDSKIRALAPAWMNACEKLNYFFSRLVWLATHCHLP